MYKFSRPSLTHHNVIRIKGMCMLGANHSHFGHNSDFEICSGSERLLAVRRFISMFEIFSRSNADFKILIGGR